MFVFVFFTLFIYLSQPISLWLYYVDRISHPFARSLAPPSPLLVFPTSNFLSAIVSSIFPLFHFSPSTLSFNIQFPKVNAKVNWNFVVEFVLIGRFWIKIQYSSYTYCLCVCMFVCVCFRLPKISSVKNKIKWHCLPKRCIPNGMEQWI